MASYGGISFDLEGTNDVFFPLMSLGIEGPPEITLDILLYSRADARALYAYRSRVTARNALGQFAGTAVVHAGAGAATLLLPTGEALALESFSALLVDLQLTRHEFNHTMYRAAASWLILSSVTG